MEALKQVVKIVMAGSLLTMLSSYICGVQACDAAGSGVVHWFMTFLLSILGIMLFVGWRLHREA